MCIRDSPKTIGKNKVVVPQKFFKVVLSPFVKPMRAIGFLFNNDQAVEPLSSYAVTIDSIESLTNICLLYTSGILLITSC